MNLTEKMLEDVSQIEEHEAKKRRNRLMVFTGLIVMSISKFLENILDKQEKFDKI